MCLFCSEELKSDAEIVRKAVSRSGWALRYVAKELLADVEMLQHALEQSGNQLDVLGLKVGLLSGRCCLEVCNRYPSRQEALRRCAASLDLDVDYVERNGTFMHGPWWPDPRDAAATCNANESADKITQSHLPLAI